jgi:hypothetical protein
VSAPAEVAPSAAVTVTVKVANAGPSAAVKTGTALLIPRGWTVASAGGGTVIGRQLITFTDASLAAEATITYAVTLTAPAAKGRALLAAAVASTVKDPDIRDNLISSPSRSANQALHRTWPSRRRSGRGWPCH